MKKPVGIHTLLITCLLLLASPLAWGIELAAAKQAGLVGEQASGYLGIVEPPGSAEVQALVADVNARRRAEYERIAARNGVALAEVEKLAAERAIARTQPGHYVRLPDGSWTIK